MIHFGTIKQVGDKHLDPLCSTSKLYSGARSDEMTQVIESTTCEVCCIMLLHALSAQMATLANTLAGLRKLRDDAAKRAMLT